MHSRVVSGPAVTDCPIAGSKERDPGANKGECADQATSGGAFEGMSFNVARAVLLQKVVESVSSPYTRSDYACSINSLLSFAAGRPLSRALLLEYRTSMESLAPSTVNVRLSAVRKWQICGRKAQY